MVLPHTYPTPPRTLLHTSPMSQSSTPREEKDVKEEMLEHTGAVLAYSAEPTALVRPAKVFNAEEEKALYRRIDLRIMPILAVLYLLSFMVSPLSFFFSNPAGGRWS